VTLQGELGRELLVAAFLVAFEQFVFAHYVLISN
jgi:hypothetical protein